MHARHDCLLVFLAGLSIAPAQIVTNHLALPPPNLPKPAVQSPVRDPVFGTPLVRLTDARAAGQPGAFPHYSKRQAWNVDESLLLLTSDDGRFSVHDGRNYAFLRVVDQVGGEDVFWHPTATNLVFYNDQNTLYTVDVWTDERILIYAATDYSYANTGGEGNLSRDGRYYAVYARDYDETAERILPRALLLIDVAEKREVSRLALLESMEDFDWISISPLGNYIVVDYATENLGRFQGVEVYDRSFNLIWQKPLGSGHSDLGVDANGEEYLAIVVYDSESNLNVSKKFRLQDGAETALISVPWNLFQHFSCRHEPASDWCFISTYAGTGLLTDDPATWFPFEDEIFAIKLDGSQQVERIAHHRSRRFSPTTPDSDTSVYWAEPHATVSRKGDRILFGSNWREAVEQVSSVDAYLADLRPMRAPRLEWQRSGEHLDLSWPAAASSWVLESTSAWPPQPAWRAAPEPAQVTVDRVTVTVSISETARFFRLKLR